MMTAVMVAKDEWVRAAMTDDKMVVELLVRLKQAQAAAPVKPPPQVIPLRWGLRLPRSRPAASASAAATSASASIRCGGDDVSRTLKEGDSSTRCSPTTPLSWSGGGCGGGAASPSATGDGVEETSSHRADGGSPSGVRSKGTAAIETTSNTAKRSRKKKTFAELKEEEGLLMEERMQLRKEIANLRATLEEQITTNESLKRMKLGLNMCSAKGSGLASCKPEKLISSQLQRTGISSPNQVYSVFPTQTRADNCPQSDSSEMHKSVSNHDRFFLLPDLNVMPSEEDYGA